MVVIGMPVFFTKQPQGIAGLGSHHATTGVNDRPSGAANRRSHLVDLFGSRVRFVDLEPGKFNCVRNRERTSNVCTFLGISINTGPVAQ